jgi:hypothetical protein
LKHLRKLTLRQKKLLSKLGYQPEKFLFIKETLDELQFYEISTAKILPIRR